MTFISEKKYLSHREIQLGDEGEGKRKAELVKVVPECRFDEPGKS